MTERLELPNQKKKKIRTFREKEIYVYLEILEADNIKQVKLKEKN